MSSSNTFTLEHSVALWKRASEVMPGGVNASARMNSALGHPIFFASGEGAYLYDVDDNRYIDYCVSHGASLLGHGNAEVAEVVSKALANGGMLACESEVQVAVAEKLLALFPGMEMVRYTETGTETTWLTLRVARTYTGRYDVVKFEGHYHGVNDIVGYSHWPDLAKAGPASSPNAVPDSAGIPPENNERIIMLPFNDTEAFERTIRAKADSIAAVIMEPISFDSCGMKPTTEFLQSVRRLTSENGIVLIFDEILSGFRTGPGPILGDECIPDMTIVGKAVGGGTPISAFLGTRAIMETCTPVGPALHSGTYNAPIMLVAAMGAFLDIVSQPSFYAELTARGDRLYAGMRDLLEQHGIKAWLQGIGARFGLLFGIDEEPRNYRDIAKQDMDMMRCFHLECLQRGVYLHYVSPHHGFSSAHSMEDIDETLNVMDDAFGALKSEG